MLLNFNFTPTGNLPGLEGAGDAVEDPSTDEERATTDEEGTDAEASSDEEPWCPPMSDSVDDPSGAEIGGAADKIETMMSSSPPNANIFLLPDSLGAATNPLATGQIDHLSDPFPISANIA